MRNAFQLQLMLIVLLNLTFVYITGAVGEAWIVPMYALTLVSPFLIGVQDKLWYRFGWNFGVVLIFGILLIDAAQNGIRFLLEDGLILAAFCQVHLLNVIKRQAGADLLFFNSFLIALVTSLFCQDLMFSIVFGFYAMVLMVALHMNAVATTPLDVPQRAMRTVRAHSLRRAATTLFVTGLAFALVPRDFERQGFVDDDLLRAVDTAGVGFSEEIRLGQSAVTPVRQRVVMRIAIQQGLPEAVPELWRGSTLSYYDHSGWQGVHLPQGSTIGGSDGNWICDDNNIVWSREHSGRTTAQLRIRCTEPVPSRLFLPLGAHTVRLDRPSYLEPLVDGTFRYNSGPPLEYRVDVEHGSLGEREVAHLAGYRQLDTSMIPRDAVSARLTEALSQIEGPHTQQKIVHACTEYLSTTFKYLLPGERGAARNLEEFLSGNSGGHCEYFATALAVMLRLKQIPCRVVTGFRVHEWDEKEREFVVRDQHAHAWVEVWDATNGWVSADATPAAEILEQQKSIWLRMRAQLEEWWSSLIQFDSDARSSALEWFLGLPAAIWFGSFERPWTTLLVVTLLVLAIRHRRRRKHRGVSSATRDYQRALRRAGIERASTETPRELLERASRELADDDTRLTELRTATEQHEAERYRMTTV